MARGHRSEPTSHKKEADVIGLVVVLFLVILVLSAFGVLGPLGRALDGFMSSAFGSVRFVVYPFIATYAVAMMFDARHSLPKRYLLSGSGALLAMMGLSSIYETSISHHGGNSSLGMRGGAIGFYAVSGGSDLLSTVGTLVVLVFAVVLFTLDLAGYSPISIIRNAKTAFEARSVRVQGLNAERDQVGADTSITQRLNSLKHWKTRLRLRSRNFYNLDRMDSEIAPYDYEEDLFSAHDSTHETGDVSSIIDFSGEPDEDSFVRDDSEQLESLDLGVRSRHDHDHDQGQDVLIANRIDEDDKEMSATSPRIASARTKAISWKLPSPSILKRSGARSLDKDELWKRGRVLADALATHKVETSLVGMTVGPTVTRYELELGAGVKVARVTALHKDIAYAMAAADVRILAPIPGRSAIGVEVPNERRVTVSLGDVLLAPEVSNVIHPLSVAIGRDISGKATMVNLAEMPHVLIAGSTGSGKSSCLNSLLTSILMRTTPEEVRLILIDPKRVELGQYNGVPHLLTPVVINPKKAANALSWAVREMERRYDLLSELGARDIVSYNETVANFAPDILAESIDTEIPSSVTAESSSLNEPGLEVQMGHAPLFASVEEKTYNHLPYILVVVDELNDLMMVAARDVEDSICRIAQMARAVGIHLVIATQRPSVDVITGLIKANIPSRMAFSVSSLADSRVILDQPGAERLIGKGDMLMLAASSSHPQRLQAPWVSEEEVRKVVGHWLRQGNADFATDFEQGVSKAARALAQEDEDELYPKALSIVVSSQLGSTSMLQRKLKVGFSRAGRLMDMLERRGVVGPLEGSKPRIVLMSLEEFEETQMSDE